MPTYSDADYQAIATSIGRDPTDVIAHARKFEAAALWYRTDRRSSGSGRRRSSPTDRKRKMMAIAGTARRLLMQLGIEDPRAAGTGPMDQELLELLTSPAGSSEDVVLEAMDRIGRLVEITDGISAVELVHRLAGQAAADAQRLGELTVTPGHTGDRAVNDWIAVMMGLYRVITGSKPRTSVGAPGTTNEGVASGPLIRFIQAAAKPLERDSTLHVDGSHEEEPEVWLLSEDALRSRVRTILNHVR